MIINLIARWLNQVFEQMAAMEDVEDDNDASVDTNNNIKSVFTEEQRALAVQQMLVAAKECDWLMAKSQACLAEIDILIEERKRLMALIKGYDAEWAKTTVIAANATSTATMTQAPLFSDL